MIYNTQSRTRNRNPIKRWFITFPTSNISKCDFATLFSQFLMIDIIYICCAEEHHADGIPHLHMLIIFQEGIKFRNLLNFVRENLPDDWKRIHFAPVRSIKHANDYIHKEDPEPHVEGTLPVRAPRKRTRSQWRVYFDANPEVYNAILYRMYEEGSETDSEEEKSN